MSKRFFGFSCFLLIICMSAVSSGAPLRILSVMNRGYGQNDFTRISEYFTGIEDNGYDTVLRTDDCVRAGTYLVIAINQSVAELSDDAFLRIKYLLSGSNKEKERVFNLRSQCGRSSWIFVGVTGADLCGCLVAWSIEIHSNDECVIENSYLWSMKEVGCSNSCEYK